MKKWILNVGLTTITVLPIVAVASCSSTTTESPSLTTEVNKYKVPFTAKGSATTMTPIAAVESINNATTPATKLSALQNLVTLNLDNQNFTYTVGTATVGTTNNQISVSFTVTTKVDTTKKDTVNLIINGFATSTESALDIEVKRFTVSEEANTEGKKLKSTELVAKITAANETAKLTELEAVVTVPKPTDGFTIKVLSAKVGTPDTSVEVVIEISQTGTQNSAQATFTVTGFSTLTASEILTAQAERLVNQTVLDGKKGETPLQASRAMTKANLNEYYQEITLSTGITYEFVSATPNTTDLIVLDVVLKVSSDVSGVNPIEKTVKITGFTSPRTLLEAEASKIINNTVISGKETETAAQAAAAITDNTKLQDYYAQVTLATGYSYTWKSDSVVGDTVSVVVTVSGPDTLAPSMEHTFIISGFEKEVVFEAKKLTTAVAKNDQGTTRQIIFGLNVTSNTEAKKLTALKAIVELPTLSEGFTIKVGLASQAETATAVNVALTVEQTGTNNTAETTFVITGLATETDQAEIARFVASNLTNQTVLPDKASETAAEAGPKITSLETLAPYYNLLPLPSNLKYNFVSKAVENDTVNVTLSISLQDGSNATQKVVTISGFKSAALVALEEKAKLLVTKETLIKNQTATQAKAAMTNGTFSSYYGTVSLGEGFGYTYANISEVDKDDPTTLNVTLRVTNRTNSASPISILWVVKITGFLQATATETEALKFSISLPTSKPETLSVGVISVLNAIGEDQNQKLIALKAYVANFPTVSDGYTLTIGQATIDTTNRTIVNIPITISPVVAESENRNETPVTVTFTITGLTEGTAEEQVNTISKLLNDRAVLSGKQNETASQAKTAITNDTQLNLYYQNTPLPTGFSYTYGGQSVINTETPTTLDVTLRLSYSGTTKDIVVKISGFTPEGSSSL